MSMRRFSLLTTHLRRPENRSPLWIDESEFGKVELPTHPLADQALAGTGPLDATGSKAVHRQGDIAPPCYRPVQDRLLAPASIRNGAHVWLRLLAVASVG